MINNQIIGKAIVFIENNLYEPIVACGVAKAVSYPYYHFHRYFNAIMGETVGSYSFYWCRNPKNYPIPEDMVIKNIQVGKHAKFIHKGTIDTLIQTYQYIWSVWFPKSNYALANRDDFKCYTNRFTDENNKKSEIDIYFPIQ